MFTSIFFVQVGFALVLFVLSTYVSFFYEKLSFFIIAGVVISTLFYFQFRFFPQDEMETVVASLWVYARIAIPVAFYIPFLINFLRYFNSPAFARLVNKDSLDYDKTYARAKQCEKSGDLHSAMKIYQHYIDTDEKDVEAHINLARLYEKCKKYEDAVRVLRPAVLYSKDAKQKLRLSFQMIEIILNKMRDVKLAMEEIEFLKRTFKGTEFENTVRKKIQLWKFQKMRELKGGPH